MSKPKVEITAEVINKIISETRPTSLTGIAHALGHKGTVSGSVAARIRELVPDVADLLAANKPSKGAKSEASGTKPEVATTAKPARKAAKGTAKPAGKKTVGTTCTIPESCPYRHSGDTPSGYAMVWSILFAHRDKGISKPDLLARYREWSGKPEQNCGFDVHVVLSPREDGSSHRSAAKAAQHYWIERQNDWYKLHLLSEKK